MVMAVASVKSMMLYHSNVNCISTSTSIGQVMLSALDEKRKRHMVMMSALDEKRNRHMVMVSALVDDKRKRHMLMMSGLADEKRKRQMVMMSALDDKSKKGGGVPNSNYVVPLDKAASCITRPLAEILRDLNKRIPDNILKPNSKQLIPWYHANRMLSFYAPGWCGEVRDVIFADDGSVTVVYRVTIRGSDGEAYRESTGTILSSDPHSVDQVGAAEEIAFVRACARFGLGLYLYHEE